MELAIAGVVIQKLSALMVEKTSQEIAVVCNFTQDFEWLKQLTSIHEYLADANSRAVEDKLVKTWLHLVQEVVWDAEDIVEEYALHTSNNIILPCFCDSFFSYKMAKRIREVRERIKSITEDGKQLKLLRDLSLSLSKHPSSSGARKENSLLLRDSHPVGIHSKVVELIEVIESRDSVIVVVAGIRGVGKTLLLRNVYNKIKGRIEERYDYSIWLSISQSYSVENLRRDLMSQIKGNKNNVSEGTAAESIEEALHRKKSLIVLDDVWRTVGDENIIESLGLPTGPDSLCRVVVTTRDRQVLGNHAVVTYHMKPLSDQESWQLFCNHAFGGEPPDRILEGIAREVEKKCGSLPLALKTVGASLSGCTETKLWRSKLHQLEVADPNYSKYPVMKVLRLSYDSLLPSLKVCFSYLSFFPEDEIIDAQYLVNLWIAEGFISQSGEDQWDTAWGYLYELANLCLLEVEEDEFLVKHCKVHDLLHDLAIVISREHQSKFAVYDDFRSAKRILLQKKEITKMEDVQPRASCPKSLRTLSLYQNPIERIEKKFVRHVRFLRVLDLSTTHISTLPTCVGKLKLLKLLNLSRTKIKDVPKCVRSLKSLLFLDVSDCEHLQSLPKWVDKLKCLQHLNIKGCQDELLDKMPREISELVALRVLRSSYLRLSVNEEDGFLKLEDIAKLTCLQEISLQVQNEMQLESFADIRWPPKMRHLSIEGTSSGVSYQLPNLSEMQELQELQTLNLSYLAFPNWVCKLTDLVELSLLHCDCEFYPELQALLNLKKLVLDGNKSCRKLPEAFGKKPGFPKLRFFHIQRFSVLEELPDFDDGAMAALEDFYIGFCPLVKKVPAGFECLSKLRRLEYTGDENDGLDKGSDFWNNIRASINDKRRSSQVEISVTII